MQPSREPRVSFRWRRVSSPAPAMMPVRILSRCAPRVKPSSPRKAMPKDRETGHLTYSPEQQDRNGEVWGKDVAGRVDLDGGGLNKQKISKMSKRKRNAKQK